MSRAANIPALTGLRAVAALWVTMTHVQNLNGDSLWFVVHGYLGVDLFFTLSGFVLSHVYGESFRRPDGPKFRQYMGLRLARIWPGYLAALAAIVLFVVAASLNGPLRDPPLDGRFWYLVLIDALMIQSWGVGVELDTFNGPAWSVSTEMIGYLLFPALAWLVWRLSPRALAGLLMPAAAAVLLASLSQADGIRGAIGLIGVPRMLGEFVAGMVLYRLSTAAAATHLPWDLLAWVALALPVTVAAIGPPATALDLVSIAGLVAFVPCLAQARGTLRAFFTHRLMIWLGEISYGIFLVHTFVLLVIITIAKRLGLIDMPFSTRRIALMAVALLLTIAGGAALYYLIERPARQWWRRRVGVGA